MAELLQGMLFDLKRIYPSWAQIEVLKNPLTEGELALAKFLDQWLQPGWDIFVQPYMNGDRPDIVILNPKVGLMIFEVKDWNPKHYHCEEEYYLDADGCEKKENRFFVTDKRGTWPIPSPIGQVERYRDNLIELYVPQIGEKIDTDSRNLAAIKTALYFHKMTTAEARRLIPSSKGCIVFGYDSLEKNLLAEMVPDGSRLSSLSQIDKWAKKIREKLRPPSYIIQQSTPIVLTEQQKRHRHLYP